MSLFPNNQRLCIGGPLNGRHVNWHAEITDGPEFYGYRLEELMINEVSTVVYIHNKLSDIEALKLLQEDYLGV